MLNREVYQNNPETRKLVNEGVAYVNDDRTESALAALRYELETFVCSGQYEKGLVRILETYLNNIGEAQQPAVWVSGFFGSGKSHLVKMLRALWTNTTFADGATARGLAHLPQSVRDCLHELDLKGKRYGGLHAASGTLGAGAGDSVRLALLGIIFRSVGLPTLYPVASFALWLKQQGLFDIVKSHVEEKGIDWDYELDNFYFSEPIHKVLVQEKRRVFSDLEKCAGLLQNRYPIQYEDISTEELLKSMHLALDHDGEFPLTLIVLDEVQQYIGEDSNRSIKVQELVEACSKSFAGRILFIGTGQTAVTGTSNLKKLEGRFTVRVELSDADVDEVIRKVILEKTPEAKAPLEEARETFSGELSRHLITTALGYRQEDMDVFAQDYPLLPVRRRFWENCLRVLDQTGTDSQLRNQLSLVHRAIRTNLDFPLGNVIAADFIFFDSTDKMLQSNTLPRRLFEKTARWIRGTDEERLMARACALVFLINRLAQSNRALGIRADVNTIADLMVEDLAEGSAHLRRELPGLLDSCELLMKIDEEYRIQTEESSAWNDEYQSNIAILASSLTRADADRDDRIRKKFASVQNSISLTQGNTRVPRVLATHFGGELPANADRKLYVWVRDGWSVTEASFQSEARQAGNNASTVFVFIPSRSADDLRRNIISAKAARLTLDKRGTPNTADGREARAAMETIFQTAENRVQELLNEAFADIRVFQAGGNEITGHDPKEMIREACANALKRLYPAFDISDHPGWARVYDRAQKGAADSLRAIGYEGEVAKHPVCKETLSAIAAGKTGADIREKFESSPYGWSRDTVDGAMQALLVAGIIRAQDERGRQIDPRELDRRAMGKTLFKVEATTVTAVQRIQIRKLFQKLNIGTVQGEELNAAQDFLRALENLAQSAGGDAPKPVRPNTDHIDDLHHLTGNELLLALFNMRETLSRNIDEWSSQAGRIEERWKEWPKLKALAGHARALPCAEDLLRQVHSIEEQRLLLDEPDPLASLKAALTQALRSELNTLKDSYEARYREGLAELREDANWQKLTPEQRNELLSEQNLDGKSQPDIALQSTEDILATLEKTSCTALKDRTDALSARFAKVAQEAAKLLEPETQYVYIPRRTLRDGADVETWLREVEAKLRKALANGPVVPR